MTLRDFILRTVADVWSFIAPAPERDPDETAKEREEERGKEGRGFDVLPVIQAPAADPSRAPAASSSRTPPGSDRGARTSDDLIRDL